MENNRMSKLIGKRTNQPIDIGYEPDADPSTDSAAGIGVLLQSDRTPKKFLVEPKSRLIDNTGLYFHYWPNP